MLVAGAEAQREQAAITGHVDAVVIVRGEVECRRAAAREGVRPFRAAKQRLNAIRQAFRLQGHAVLHRAVVGAATIDRADNGGVIRLYWARACCQRTGEKVVERCEGVRVFLGGKIHIGAGNFHIGTDNGVFQKARFHPRQAIHQRAR